MMSPGKTVSVPTEIGTLTVERDNARDSLDPKCSKVFSCGNRYSNQGKPLIGSAMRRATAAVRS
jgi:hypothetical protein